ncbi:hypothetical protein Patl1_19344 [Pistacia atlantica]|uniref:Uncharacterized protein n=1 Tax=Pistacia atlantica TaxID=434234 RepID=A0ACC1C3J4_9ROSI|nr:hypothetical protein Patl1_19344 [Pistacia atlantica]
MSPPPPRNTSPRPLTSTPSPPSPQQFISPPPPPPPLYLIHQPVHRPPPVASNPLTSSSSPPPPISNPPRSSPPPPPVFTPPTNSPLPPMANPPTSPPSPSNLSPSPPSDPPKASPPPQTPSTPPNSSYLMINMLCPIKSRNNTSFCLSRKPGDSRTGKFDFGFASFGVETTSFCGIWVWVLVGGEGVGVLGDEFLEGEDIWEARGVGGGLEVRSDGVFGVVEAGEEGGGWMSRVSRLCGFLNEFGDDMRDAPAKRISPASTGVSFVNFGLEFDKILVVVVVVNMMGVVGEICGKWLSGTAGLEGHSFVLSIKLVLLREFESCEKKVLFVCKNGGSKRGNTQYGMEKLVGNNNYKYWRMCMEAYLQGQDLWELVTGADAGIPTNIPEHAESRRKWKIKCGKTLFALRTSISKEFIDHVRDVSSPKEVWDTLEKLCTKKNTARLQLLENELAMLKQGGMSISEYFLRVKSICAEISEIDADDKISEARLRRYLVGGLRKEYGPFVTSIQGWSQKPSIEELENLLSNQEALAKQMAKKFESILFFFF